MTKHVHLMLLTEAEFCLMKGILYKHYQDCMAEHRQRFLEQNRRNIIPLRKFYLILDEEEQKDPQYGYNRIVALEGIKHVSEEGEVEWMLELTNHEANYLVNASAHPPVFSRDVRVRK